MTFYKWQLLHPTFGWLTIQGAVGQTFQTLPLDVGTHLYRVLISQDEGCLATSDTAVITVVQDPTVLITADDIDICLLNYRGITVFVDIELNIFIDKLLSDYYRFIFC